ncbi:hypothetical protein BLA29_015034, partial [Euroglyphus maynei]
MALSFLTTKSTSDVDKDKMTKLQVEDGKEEGRVVPESSDEIPESSDEKSKTPAETASAAATESGETSNESSGDETA